MDAVEISPEHVARWQEMADRREIDDVLCRYAWTLDHHDWNVLRDEVFTADATIDFLEYGGLFEGIDAIVANISRVLGGLDASQHLIGTSSAEIDGDTATARCDRQAQHVLDAAPGDGSQLLFGGTYVDQLVRTAVGWRIKHRTLHPTWVAGNSEVLSATREPSA